MTQIIRRWTVTTLIALALAVFGSVHAQSTEALETQLATAVQHAGFAMSAAEHDMAVRHLGHVLNCIAGEDGEGFDAAWGHPCAGQGEGILVDVEAHAHAADVAALLAAAHTLAIQGVKADVLGAVRAAAAGVRALLEVLAGFGG